MIRREKLHLYTKKKRHQQDVDDLVKQMNVCKKVLEKLAENLKKDKNSPSELKAKNSKNR
jgi:hypothetical protein